MNSDTSHPREYPERPDLPIEGRSFDTWCNHWRKELSAYFYELTGGYLSSEEWEMRSKAFFTVQQTREML
jgi:hypothetical protein